MAVHSIFSKSEKQTFIVDTDLHGQNQINIKHKVDRNNHLLFHNGLYLIEGVDYNIDYKSIRFSHDIYVGDKIEIIWIHHI